MNVAQTRTIKRSVFTNHNPWGIPYVDYLVDVAKVSTSMFPIPTERTVPARDWSCHRPCARAPAPRQRRPHSHPFPERCSAHACMVQHVLSSQGEPVRRRLPILLYHALRYHGEYTQLPFIQMSELLHDVYIILFTKATDLTPLPCISRRSRTTGGPKLSRLWTPIGRRRLARCSSRSWPSLTSRRSISCTSVEVSGLRLLHEAFNMLLIDNRSEVPILVVSADNGRTGWNHAMCVCPDAVDHGACFQPHVCLAR